MSEGSLGAPERRPILWENPEFYDEESLDKELRRQFDICHGCRRCHNLCDSFPRLFDLIDESESMELDTVKSEDFKSSPFPHMFKDSFMEDDPFRALMSELKKSCIIALNSDLDSALNILLDFNDSTINDISILFAAVS